MKQLLNYIKPRWRKVLADLWDSKTRTILVVASIAVGVFAIGAIVSAYAIMAEDIDFSYISSSPANIIIATDGFDDDFLKSIEKIPGVEDVDGRYSQTIRASKDGEEWQSLDLMARDEFGTATVNRIEVTEGKLNAQDDEILISYDTLVDPGFRVGDTAQIQLEDGTTRVYEVVGLIKDQSKAGDFVALPRVYLTTEQIDKFGLPQHYNRLYATVSENQDDKDAIETVAEEIETKIQKDGRFVYNTTIVTTDGHPMSSTILAMLGVLGALGVLVMLLSSSLIFNTLNALLSQHLRQIGVMKLIGGRSVQISIMYILLIIAYGLIALIISVPTGALAGYGMSAFIANFMSANLQGFRIIPQAIVVQVIIAFAVPLAAGFFPVNHGSKIKVRRALSNDGGGDQVTTTSFLDRIGKVLQWISRPILLSIRNTFRRKGRLALTMFTLTVAGAIFISVYNVQASLEQFMDQIGQHFMADITVTFDEPYRLEKVEQSALQIPGIDESEGWLVGIADVVDDNTAVPVSVSLIAPPVDTELLEPEMVVGRWMQPGDEDFVVLADTIWEDYPDLQPGDTINLEISGERAKDYTILGFFRFIGMVGVHIGYTDFETMAEILNLPDQSFSYRFVADPAAASTLEEQQQLSNEVDTYLRSQGYKINNIEAGLVVQEENSQGINILINFLLVMALLTAFVGSIGLTGTMGMNVLERTREIGVMRAIGATDLEIIKTVVIEGAMIGFISWLFAIFISFPISYGLLYIIANALLNAGLPLVITPQGYIIWLGVVMALSVIASMLPARNASRLTIREVLAYE